MKMKLNAQPSDTSGRSHASSFLIPDTPFNVDIEAVQDPSAVGTVELHAINEKDVSDIDEVFLANRIQPPLKTESPKRSPSTNRCRKEGAVCRTPSPKITRTDTTCVVYDLACTRRQNEKLLMGHF